MAVQKSKVSKSRKGQRRSHHAIKEPTLSTDSVTGERHLRHHMTPEGFYKGEQVREVKLKESIETEETEETT